MIDDKIFELQFSRLKLQAGLLFEGCRRVPRTKTFAGDIAPIAIGRPVEREIEELRQPGHVENGPIRRLRSGGLRRVQIRNETRHRHMMKFEVPGSHFDAECAGGGGFEPGTALCHDQRRTGRSRLAMGREFEPRRRSAPAA